MAVKLTALQAQRWWESLCPLPTVRINQANWFNTLLIYKNIIFLFGWPWLNEGWMLMQWLPALSVLLCYMLFLVVMLPQTQAYNWGQAQNSIVVLFNQCLCLNIYTCRFFTSVFKLQPPLQMTITGTGMMNRHQYALGCVHVLRSR